MEAQAYWPNSIRASYGIRASEDDEYNNAVHGSDSHAAALREIHYFFPERKYLSAPLALDTYIIYCQEQSFENNRTTGQAKKKYH